MNIVLGECDEIHLKSNKRVPVGKIMLKGDNVSLIRAVST